MAERLRPTRFGSRDEPTTLLAARLSYFTSAKVITTGPLSAREIDHLIRLLTLQRDWQQEWDRSPERILLDAQTAWLESAQVIPLNAKAERERVDGYNENKYGPA